MIEKYRKILDMPHHVSVNHPRMSMCQRAAQFAPFAALTGHGEAINETARTTQERIQLSEHERSLLDRKLSSILTHVDERPNIEITYFVPDEYKAGGHYTNHSGHIRKILDYENVIILDDGTKIDVSDIIAIDFLDGNPLSPI